jgi:hypothetical protein
MAYTYWQQPPEGDILYIVISQVHGFHLSLFLQNSPSFMRFKELCLSVTQNLVQDAKCPGVFPVLKYDKPSNAY